MAIVRASPTNTPGPDDLSLIFNNGDLAALKTAAERLGFKDVESLIRFALAVLSRSATRSLTVTDQNGEQVSLTPGAGLLKEERAS